MNKTNRLVLSEDMLPYLEFIRHKRQEYLLSLSLDSGSRLIARHPREVFAGPLKDRAARVVIAHNHPSGEVEPSSQDIKTTQQLIAAGQILGVPLYDHLIITAKGHYSFRKNGLI